MAANTKTKKVQDNPTEVQTEETPVVKRSYKVRKDLDPRSVIPVRNGFNGLLIYKSKRSKETIKWDDFGDEQDVELAELKYAKGADKDFFINNWFLIDDPAVIDYLGVEQYYKNSLKYDNFDDVFSMDVDEMEATLSKIPKGQKSSVIYRAKQLIEDEVIDSIKVINTLEKVLSVELIER